MKPVSAAIVTLICMVAVASCSPAEVGSPVTTAATLATSTTTAPPDTTAPTGSVPSSGEPATWLLGGALGLTDPEGASVLSTNTAVEDLARDKKGGVALMLEDGLYWWAPDSDEPVFVADVHGDLVEVVDIGGVPHARIGLCDSSDVDLTSGDIVASSTPGRVEADCSAESPSVRWNADSGLSIRIVPALTTTVTDAEGTSVVEPARLEVTRADQHLFDVPVGGFYEAEARIEDFDGRWLLVSRHPVDGEDRLHTFFLIDLSTGAATTLITEAVAGTLLGPDSDWAAAALAPDAPPFGSVPLISDDRVTELADGRYVAFIDHVFTEGYRGGPEVHFDLAVWFFGPEATHFAEIDGVDAPGDYYIRNQDPTVLVGEVSPNVEVSSVWLGSDGGGGFEPVEISFGELVAAMEGDAEGPEINMRNGPWWLTIDGGVIVAIDEQYVP